MTEWSREKLLETSGLYWRSLVLQTAVKLDVFTLVGSGSVTAGKIAEVIDGDERAVTMLLNALVAMGLLNKLDGGFANTDASRVCLAKDSESYIGHLILHHHHLVEPWSHLDEAVRSGEPIHANADRGDEVWRESFLLGMHNQACAVAPLVAESVDLSGRRHLLDLGGGPGTYAIHFCQRNADLRATIYDLPTTRPFAEGTVAKYDMAKRIDFVAGDFTQEQIKGRYDAAWLSHILHGESPEQCAEVIRKAAEALEPGGVLLVHEYILDDDMASPPFPALFSLNMLIATEQGQSYSGSQLMGMLEAAGLCDVKRLDFTGPNDSGIVAGRRKGVRNL